LFAKLQDLNDNIGILVFYQLLIYLNNMLIVVYYQEDT